MPKTWVNFDIDIIYLSAHTSLRLPAFFNSLGVSERSLIRHLAINDDVIDINTPQAYDEFPDRLRRAVEQFENSETLYEVTDIFTYVSFFDRGVENQNDEDDWTCRHFWNPSTRLLAAGLGMYEDLVEEPKKRSKTHIHEWRVLEKVYLVRWPLDADIVTFTTVDKIDEAVRDEESGADVLEHCETTTQRAIKLGSFLLDDGSHFRFKTNQRPRLKHILAVV